MKDDFYYDRLKKHTLELVQGGAVTAYYLREKPNSRMMATLITFSPEGITLTGDLTPEQNGTVSRGYGIEWFAGKMDRGYLASKFLQKKWSEDIAKRELAAEAERLHKKQEFGGLGGVSKRVRHPTPEEHKLANAIQELVKSDWDGGGEWLRDQLDDIGYDTSDGIPGTGYLDHEAGWLYAIQRRFSELYHAQQSQLVASATYQEK